MNNISVDIYRCQYPLGVKCKIYTSTTTNSILLSEVKIFSHLSYYCFLKNDDSGVKGTNEQNREKFI